jgi:hypothetical protein
MTKKNTEQKITRKTLLQDIGTQYAHRLDNEQYNGKYLKGVQFLESILADDDDRESQSREDKQARQTTAACILSLVANQPDTDVGERSGGSRPVVGAVPPDAPRQLTGGFSSNFSLPPSPPPTDVTPANPRPGGYDGGLAIGWEGTWNGQFKAVVAALESAKEHAQNVRSGEHVKINLGGFDVIVDPSGGKVGGNVWHYKFHAFGVTFLIHRNPKNTQQVRAVYGAEALMLNPLPALHAHVLHFLSSLGLTITKETLTRVDMQVMVDVPLLDFIMLIFGKHAVKKARNSALFLRSDIPETYRTGDIDDVQICIYDKRAEMRRMKLEKWQLTVEHCIGGEWWASNRPITRVEVRLGRSALKGFKVNSVEDMLKSERGIIDLITQDWFRLLEKPKKQGMGKRAKMHPRWERVRALFFEHFTGSENRDIEYRKPTPMLCDPTSLVQQGVGCLAKAIAYERGKQASSTDVVKYFEDLARTTKDTVFRKANQCIEALEIIKGVSLGGIDKDTLEQIRNKVFENFYHPELRLRR